MMDGVVLLIFAYLLILTVMVCSAMCAELRRRRDDREARRRHPGFAWPGPAVGPPAWHPEHAAHPNARRPPPYDWEVDE